MRGAELPFGVMNDQTAEEAHAKPAWFGTSYDRWKIPALSLERRYTDAESAQQPQGLPDFPNAPPQRNRRISSWSSENGAEEVVIREIWHDLFFFARVTL
ncbi:hypothetical protein [Agromyces sp. NPDC056965]|uniref:hypothetical protein n=1 Tax=Agromyces sp. NPDC056965 TaxID=3345983 RepID=UPI0036428EED